MASAEELINDARSYAAEVLDSARTALDSAANQINSVGFAQPDLDLDPIDQQLPVPDLPDVPEFAGVELSLPADPGSAPAFQDIGTINTGDAPVLSASVPTLNLPSQPTPVASFTGTLPIIDTQVEFPEPPDQLINPLIAEPVIQDRAAPAKPDVVLPIFDAAAPVFSAVAPTDLRGEMERAYRDMSPTVTAVLEGQVDALIGKYCPRFHSGMEQMEAQLQRFLDGGTGFKPAVENAIYERTKDKALGEYRRTRDAAWADAAARGFTLPNGALMAAQMQARQSAADNLARAASDIAIKQAEIEQQNLQFAVTTSANLRTTIFNSALSYHQNLIQINGQVLDYAKTAVSLLVETFNTEVKAFSARLDAWRAEAAVFEVRLKGVLASIDLYKAEIDALQALTQVDMAKVNVFKARLEALDSLASVYRSRIDAIVTKANMQKLKLDLFQSQVQAYSAQVQAKNSEWQGYSAALGGEEVKARIFGTQVQAFGAEVNGWTAKINAQSEAVRAASLTNESRARQYEAAWRAYSAVVSAKGEVARTQLESDRQQLLAFQAKTQAQVSYAQTAATFYKARADVQVSYADMRLKAQLGQIDSMRNYQDVVSRLANTNAQLHSTVTTGALAGINSLAIKPE